MILLHIIFTHSSYDCLVLCPEIHGVRVLFIWTEMTITSCYIGRLLFSKPLKHVIFPTLSITSFSEFLFLFYTLIKETASSLSLGVETLYLHLTSQWPTTVVLGNPFSSTVKSMCWKSISASGKPHLSNFMFLPLGSLLSASVFYNSLDDCLDAEPRFCMAPQGKIVFLSWQCPSSLDR